MRFAELTPEPADWLAAAGDAALVGAALRAADADLASLLVGCRPKRFRLGDGGSCRGTYVLTLKGDRGEEEVTVEAVVYAPGSTPDPPAAGVRFGHRDWAVRLDGLGVDVRTAACETVLSAYEELRDPAGAPAVLTEVLKTGTRHDRGIVVTSAEAEVLRYKPGSRCTFRMTVEATGPGAADLPSVMIAKTHAGTKGLVADRSMRALWTSPLRASSITIAEPLGYDPLRRILLQGPIAEDCTLRDLLISWFADDGRVSWDRLVELVTRTGAGLAALHDCGVVVGDAVGVTDELDEIRRRAARVAAAFPDCRPMLASVTDMLDTLAAATSAGPARPAHRSFRPAQILIAGDELGFIDFDGFCQAEPAMDIAMFTSMVRSIGLHKGVEDKTDLRDMASARRNARLADAHRLCAAFLEGYRSRSDIEPHRLALWETVHVAGVVVASWTKLKLARLPNALFLLDEQLTRNSD